MCAVHVVNDMQYVVYDCCNVRCVDVLFFLTCCFEVLYGQLWNVFHFYVQDGNRYLKCNKNRCFFWSFHNLRKRILFFILLSCFKQCVLGLSGLLGLNAVIILPFNCMQCNHCLVFGDVLCNLPGLYYYVSKQGVQFQCVDVLGTTLMVC